MAEFTHGQEVTLDMMKMAAAEAKQAFESLDRKAQELLGIGSIVLGLIGLNSAIASGPSGSLSLRPYIFRIGAICFFAVFVFVLMTKLPRKVKAAPMEPTQEAAAGWADLGSNDLWMKLVVQYEEVIGSYGAANRAKRKETFAAQIFLSLEMTFVAFAFLMP